MFLATAVGCNNSPGVSASAPVSGTVLLDGNPMPDGEVRFSVAGEPPRTLAVREGKFSGEVAVGENRVAVIWEKDGPPHPMDPTQKLKVNVVDDKFSGPNSVLTQKVASGGATDLKLEVTSAKR